MSTPALRVEGLSKQFELGHRLSYHRFTEFIENVARNAVRLPFELVRRKPSAQAQTQETDLLWALKDVSFEVARGEVLGIIGRNGAGKSTLLKLLSRITAPTRGRIEIRGRVGSLLEVGTGFHPELTGRENIFLNGAILGMTRREVRRKLDEIVAFSEVERFLDTPVKHYSSGMQMRLAFSVAAHLEPEVLIVDEVLAVGDAAFQKKCLGVMQDVAQSGCTCLVVSHNLSTVANLCQRALLLQEGALIADGPAPDVVRKYLATTLDLGGEIAWPVAESAPGNDVVRLHAVRIRQAGSDDTTADVDISRDVDIEIEYWNLAANECLYAALWLKDQVATPVLSTSSARPVSLTPDAWSGRPHPVGLYRSVCRIPGNFLNEGRYSVTAIVGRGISDTQVLREDVISFNVHDTGEMRGQYFGHWLGVVRPKLPWSTERFDAN